MRTHLMLAAGLILLAAAPAAMAGPFDAEAAISQDDLDGKRGGTAAGSLAQGNYTDQSATNNGSVSVGGAASKYTGGISPTTVTGNHGITAVMQNTGDLVNMNNATSVNVYMR